MHDILILGLISRIFSWSEKKNAQNKGMLFYRIAAFSGNLLWYKQRLIANSSLQPWTILITIGLILDFSNTVYKIVQAQ